MPAPGRVVEFAALSAGCSRGLQLLRPAASRARATLIARARAPAPLGRSATTLCAPRAPGAAALRLARCAHAHLSTANAQLSSLSVPPPLDFDFDGEDGGSSGQYLREAFAQFHGRQRRSSAEVASDGERKAAISARDEEQIDEYYASLRAEYGDDVELPARERVREQLHREERVYQLAVEEYRALHENLVARGLVTQLGGRQVKTQLAMWVRTLAHGVQHELHVAERSGRSGCAFAPICEALRLIPSDTLAVITLHTCVGQLMREPGGLSYTQVARELGKHVRDEYEVIVSDETKRRERALHAARSEEGGEGGGEGSGAAEGLAGASASTAGSTGAEAAVEAANVAAADGVAPASARAPAGGETGGGTSRSGKRAKRSPRAREGASGTTVAELAGMEWPPPNPWAGDAKKSEDGAEELEVKVSSFLILQLLTHCKVALTDEEVAHYGAQHADAYDVPAPVEGASPPERHVIPRQATRARLEHAGESAGTADDGAEGAAGGAGAPAGEAGEVAVWICPAFGHRLVPFGNKVQKSKGMRRMRGELIAHPALYDWLRSPLTASLHKARFEPMLVPPLPWRGVSDGGFLTVGRPIARRATRAQVGKMEAAAESMSTVYRGLNVLASTPWRIDGKVLAASRALWDAGGHVAALPRRESVPIAEMPDKAAASDTEMKQWRYAAYRTHKDNAEQHSLSCDHQIKLSQAESLLDAPRVYFPHSMDFRGRVYPMPPNLNHLGADASRALLRFARARALGERGTGWLLVHLANLCGHDKVPMADRRDWSAAHVAHVCASSADPLRNRWWAEQDEPFQVLAACHELAAVLSMPAHARPLFESSLPVHMDGSCNGLQHYAVRAATAAISARAPRSRAQLRRARHRGAHAAPRAARRARRATGASARLPPAQALGRDANGGEQVNLTRRTVPGDVYMAVARDVISRNAREAAEGNKSAVLLDGHISRKVVKQTVMTSVYGVTMIGGRDQVLSRLRELPCMHDVDDAELSAAALYLARLTLDSLGVVFVSAKAIQDWLGKVASKVTKVRAAVELGREARAGASAATLHRELRGRGGGGGAVRLVPRRPGWRVRSSCRRLPPRCAAAPPRRRVHATPSSQL